MATARRLLVVTTASSYINPNSSNPADPPEPLVTVESDFVVIVAALLCALICVLGLFAVARCAWLRNSITSNNSTATNTTTTAYSSAGAANKGLKKKVLQSFPKFVFDSNNHSPSSSAASGTGCVGLDDCCAICLAEFVDGDEIRVLPHCGHGFHAGCVDTWLSRRSSCPSCRRILVGGKNRCLNCGHLPAIAPPV